MLRSIRNRALTLALIGFSSGPALAQPTVPAAPALPAAGALAPAASPVYRVDQLIVLKENGKPDRRCKVLSVIKRAEGGYGYQVKALDNGEVMTVLDRKHHDPEKKVVPAKSSNLIAVKAASAASRADQPADFPDIGKPEDSQPAKGKIGITVAQPMPVPPLLSPAKVEAPPQSPKRSFFDRLFGRSPKAAESCNTCNSKLANSPTPMPAMAAASKTGGAPCQGSPAVNTGVAGSFKTPGATVCDICKPKVAGRTGSCETCKIIPAPPRPTGIVDADPLDFGAQGKAFVTSEPPVRRLPTEPVPIGFGPQLPITAAMRSLPTEPAPLPVHQMPADPVRQAVAYEQNRTAELKEALKNAERPSHRMTAAEELSTGSRGQSADVRAALMLAAQDDAAGCVRATCIRCLSRQGARDQAFMTLLVAAQNDKDAAVREEAGYAMQKATRR